MLDQIPAFQGTGCVRVFCFDRQSARQTATDTQTQSARYIVKKARETAKETRKEKTEKSKDIPEAISIKEANENEAASQ